MVYAKSAEAAKHYLRLQDQRGAITKDYVAVVGGTPAKAAGRVAGGICPSRDRTSYVIRGKGSGKAVLTTYRLLASDCHPRLGDLSGLSIRLFSGRKHQIRASCRHLGCPIVGDDRYGGLAYGTTLLHASRSAFVGRKGHKYDVSCGPVWADDTLWREPDYAAFFAGLLASPTAEGAAVSTDVGDQ
jgi:23S rRNA-/tRNA-specific pseudouridylate synthase